MDDKTKLVVFDRKEVFLLFCLVILAAITSFVFGVKVGKNYSFERAGLSHQDEQVLDLKSKEEEEVQKAVEAANAEHAVSPSTEETLKRLEDEFNQVSGTPGSATTTNHESATTELHGAEELKQDAHAGQTQESHESQSHDAPLTKPTGYEGKYTIQVGSYPNMEDAKQFAEGFKIRGYNPYVYEVIIDGKGTWYRVTLGVFENAQQARDYIKQEESLFQGQDYDITVFK